MAYKRKMYKRRAPKRTYKRRPAAKRSSLKRLVRREIVKQAEPKTQQNFVLQHDILPSNAAAFDTQLLPLTPDAIGLLIAQGSAQGQRVGNRVRIKSLTFKGVIHPLAYNATTNPTPCPVQVNIWLFYDKTNPTVVPTPKLNGDFLQFGNTTSGLQNDLMDTVAPVNTDRYRVFAKRTYKIGYAENTGTGAIPAQGNLANNDFKLNQTFSFDLTKFAPKIVRWRDAVSNPSSRGVYMMAQAIYANGVNMASTTIPAAMSYIQSIDYVDM